MSIGAGALSSPLLILWIMRGARGGGLRVGRLPTRAPPRPPCWPGGLGGCFGRVSDVLLLDATYAPLRTLPWQRAVTLFFLGKVEVLEEYEARPLRSPSITIAMPAVVRLLRLVPRPRVQVKFSRSNVYRRDEHACQYCGERPGVTGLTYDHVMPRARGGRTSWTNIVTCCVRCNLRKGDRTPIEAGMLLRRAPQRPRGIDDLVAVSSVGAPQIWREYLWSSSRGDPPERATG